MKNKLIKEYISTGGSLFKITNIHQYRDGGNFVILTTKNDYYIDKDNFTIHFSYPPNKTNELDDKHLKAYLLECFEKFIKNKELELKLNKNLFDKLKI